MFDWILMLVSVVALWTALLLVFVLFAIRLYEVISSKARWDHALAVLLIPFSIGYFYANQKKSRLKTIYETLIVVQFLLGILAFIIIFYTRFM